ncbi:MAG: cation transporter [Clostridiales bacterium]|nr:cation transporter [Clostridiales bacterium]
MENEQSVIRKVTLVGVGGNVLLTAFKMTAGILGKSGAMVSDAVHSLSDVFATLIAYLGTRISKRSPDKEHPYGHERLECVASLILGLVLAATGIGIGRVGILNIISGDYASLEVPRLIALIASVVSIVTKELMFWYTRHYAKKIDSQVFMADAWHHRSDAFSSVGSLIGIGGAMLGYPVLDSVASVVICVFILKVAYDIIKGAISNMIDTSCGEEYEKQVSDYVMSVEGVKSIDLLHTRKFGNKVYIDIEIGVDSNGTFRSAHDISERVHSGVEEKFENVKHVMVHANPHDGSDT